MSAEDPRDQYAGPNLRFEVPFDLEHAPVSLNSDGREAFLLTLPLSFTIRANKRGSACNELVAMKRSKILAS